jgi:hypothetical protein
MHLVEQFMRSIGHKLPCMTLPSKSGVLEP